MLSALYNSSPSKFIYYRVCITVKRLIRLDKLLNTEIKVRVSQLKLFKEFLGIVYGTQNYFVI